MQTPRTVRMNALAALLDNLLSRQVTRIESLLRDAPGDSKVEGVYVISAPSDPDSLVYVGRTKSKTVHGRLKDHCSINTASDLRGMLSRWPDYPQRAESFGVRWLEIADPSERAFFECFVIAILQPTFNRP